MLGLVSAHRLPGEPRKTIGQRLPAAAVRSVLEPCRNGASKQIEGDTITCNWRPAPADIARAAARADELLAGARREDVTQVMADLRSATRSLDDAAANAAVLIGDPEIRDDLKATIRTTREAAEEARDVVARIGEMVGLRRNGSSEPRPKVQPAGGKGASVDFLYDADRGNTRLDANVAFTAGGQHFYRLGVFDLGEDARVNLQMGRNLGPDRSFRWGLYQSRIGMGYDWQADSKLFLHPIATAQRSRGWMSRPRTITEGRGGWAGFRGIDRGDRPRRVQVGSAFPTCRIRDGPRSTDTYGSMREKFSLKSHTHEGCGRTAESRETFTRGARRFARQLSVPPPETPSSRPLSNRRQNREAHQLEEALKTATDSPKGRLKLQGKTSKLWRKEPSGTKLYGSITSHDIADAIQQMCGLEVDKRKITLAKPIRSTGTYEVPVQLHRDVVVRLNVDVVAASGEEH